MKDELENLLSAYERGRFSRRTFIAALSALLSVPSVGQTSPTAPFVANGLNHVTLNVPDVSRSRDFYQHLLGSSVLQEDKEGCNLRISSSSFLGIYASRERPTVD